MMAISFKGAHFPQDSMLMGVRGYMASPLSYRPVEELMEERGGAVDPAPVPRWVVKYRPRLEAAFHRCKQPVWVSWRLDETYVKVQGEWRYLYRAGDKQGQPMDFLLPEDRDPEAALRFLKKAIRCHGLPETITLDGSDANAAAIKSDNEAHGTNILIRQVKYFNNVFAMKGFHHPGGSQQAFLTGLAHLYNLVPKVSQRCGCALLSARL